MAQTILLRRGLATASTAITPLAGEPIFLTDTNKLRFGDGSTLGGVDIAYLGTELRGASEGVASLVGGTIPTSQLPSSALIGNLAGLTDTTLGTLVADDYLKWDGSAWVNSAPQTVAIDDLSDVDTTTTSPSNGEALIWNGTDWANSELPAVGDGTFTGLTDVPGYVAGDAGKSVVINATETGVEFVALSSTNITEGTNLYYTDARSDARVQNAISDTTTSTTTLWSSDKINSVMISGISYQGHWDASTNSPTLTNGTIGANPDLHGDFYIVSVAGSQDFGAGTIAFEVGDNVIYDDDLGTWEKSVNSNKVQSVNGDIGTVELSLDDIYGVVAPAPTNAQILSWNSTLSNDEGGTGAWEPVDAGSVTVTAFTSLSDVQNNYTGAAGNFVRVNAAEDAVEFVTASTSDISEGSNLYYTDARVNTVIAATSIDALSDIDTTTTAPAVDDILGWDGTNWVPGANIDGGTF